MGRGKKFLGIILLLIITILGGCSTEKTVSDTKKSSETVTIKTANTEKAIVKDSKKISKMFAVDATVNIDVKKKTDRFLMYSGGRKIITMLMPCDFYERNEFEIPEVEENEIPSLYKRLLDKPQKIVLNYISNSDKIEEPDKRECRKAVKEVKLHYGTFKTCTTVPIITIKNEIYINTIFDKYISEYLYLHELVHIISNTTNKGSKYEKCFYRASKLNEVITDLIAFNLAKKNKIIAYEDVGYRDYYEPVYYLIAKYDILKAYYYSNYYQKIIEEIGQNEFDLYVLLVENFNDGKSDKAISYSINEFLK